MKNPCTRLSAYFVAAVSLLFISAIYAGAQQQGRVLAPRLETLETVRERMRRGDDQRIYDSLGEPANPFDAYRRRALESRLARAAQVRKDTERIQFFNREMMRSVASGAPLDYDRIIKATGEIRKRAARMMLNLNLPKLDKSEMPQAEGELFDNQSLAASLIKLDEMVKRFGANPLPRLGKVAVLDVKAVTDARLNLAGIVVLSEKIRKSARQLAKAAPRQL
jgi:hypothetical protein